ncbi:hypothetical protein VNO77_01105 [Canavalia gladiata]|uniref:Uncharacterized protein n=1 Tax=Canavalia gladiata TaxID=3824 RepID=A0AAN9MVG7_CANGL
MPSSSAKNKKRRAARRKKQKKRNTTNPQGNDDLKFQNEKGNGGGEGSSHAHREHDDHHHPFNDGSKKVEERDTSAAQPHVSDVKSVEEVASDVKIDQGKEDGVVLVEGSLKSEESSERKNVSVDHIETAKESYYENGNTGDTSKGESLPEKNTKDESCNLFEEAIACHELVKPTDSPPSKMIEINGNALVEETVNSAADPYVSSDKAATSVSKVENSGSGSVLLEKSAVHPAEVTSLAMKTNEDNVYSLSDENVAKSSMKEPKPKEYDSKVLDLLSANPLTKFTNGAEHINSAADSYVSSDKAVASVPEVENSDSGRVLLEKSIVHPVEVTNLAMKTNEDNAYSLTNRNVTKPSIEETKPKEYDSEVLDLLSASPFTKFTDGAEHIKDSETAVRSENQFCQVLIDNSEILAWVSQLMTQNL